MTLHEFIQAMKTTDTKTDARHDESQRELAARISQPGVVHEVTEDTYDYYLEVLPPRWMGGLAFAFGEGADDLRLFWKQRTPIGRRFFCRQMTEAESEQFCTLAGIGRSSG